MLPFVRPVRVELVGFGEGWSDIAFGPSNQILISTRLKHAFEAAGLVGLTHVDPVEIVKLRRRRLPLKGSVPEYWLGTIARSRAILDDIASGMQREGGGVCSECGLGGLIKRYRCVAIRAGTWSGEDLFYARGLPGAIIASERFKLMCEEFRFAKGLLVNAADYGVNYYPLEGS
jgi:hypothetical protein